MRFPIRLFLALQAIGLSPVYASEAADLSPLYTNAADLVRLSDAQVRAHVKFDLRGVVTSCGTMTFTLQDASSGIFIVAKSQEPHQTGDVLRVTGSSQCYPSGHRVFLAQTIERLGSAPIPECVETTIMRTADNTCDFRRIRVRGWVTDILADDVDPDFLCIILRSQGKSLFVSIPSANLEEVDLTPLEGTEICVQGVYVPWQMSDRVYQGPILLTMGIQDILSTADSGIAIDDYPELPRLSNVAPDDILAFGHCRIRGQVLAAWDGNRVLLRTQQGRFHGLTLARGMPLPSFGETIVAGGMTETDLYCINLSHARYRPDNSPLDLTLPAVPMSLRNMLVGKNGKRKIDSTCHGKTIRLTGTVIRLPADDYVEDKLHLSCDGFVIPVDMGAARTQKTDLAVGCRIEATGACVMNVRNWHPKAPFPPVRGFTLVTRGPDDIRVLSRPSWWTARRLLAVVIALLAALTAIFAWNRMLSRHIRSKSRELAKSEIDRCVSLFKISERTDLAVELHDTFSQNLTAVSCQIAAAARSLASRPDAAQRSLNIAEQMLRSCHAELRECLSDLRSDTLEEPDFAEAIRKVLAKAEHSARISIRFRVPRTILLDTTAHAILCIIRELAANAVRHGGATAIWVAGNIENGRLSFSVRDNGTGFDPLAHPGPSEGHFGIDGIRTRIRRLNGRFEIESSPGHGCRSIVSIDLPRRITP